MIADAIHQGCHSFILGIGGSATNDCGIGCLQALGFGFYDKNGNPVPFGAKGLAQVHHIDLNQVIPKLRYHQFHVACDVTNPLCGENGCSAVFAPQKGADSLMIAEMERSMQRFSAIVKKYYPDSDADLPGSGAAGGLGFALRTFLNADLKPGIDVVINQTGIETAIRDADIVVTGEGRLDAQTVMGKVPVGIARIAKKYDLPVIAFCGCVGDGAEICNQHGIDAYFPILRSITTAEEAMKPEIAKKNLADTAEQVFRLFRCT